MLINAIVLSKLQISLSNTTSGAGAGGAAGASASFFFLEVSSFINRNIEKTIIRKSIID